MKTINFNEKVLENITYKVIDNKTIKFFDKSKSILKPKKISSRNVPILLGKNGFNKRGDAILDLFRFIKGEDIDQRYTIRGEIGEKIAKEFFEKFDKWNIKRFLAKDYEYYNQFVENKFSNEPIQKYYKYFSGLCDLELTRKDNNLKEIVVEVKTKDIKKKEEIINAGGVLEEVIQGKVLAFLDEAKYLVMVYVFFDEDNEALKMKTTTRDYYLQTKSELKALNRIEIDKKEIGLMLAEAYKYYKSCYDSFSVDISDLSGYVQDSIISKLRKEE